MTPQILVYNITDEKRRRTLKSILLRLKIRVRIIEKEHYTSPLGSFAGLSPTEFLSRPEDSVLREAALDLQDFSDEMLVLCFFSEPLLNQFLLALRKNTLSIPLKAVLTPSNCSWNSLMLYHEITAEHKKMHSQ